MASTVNRTTFLVDGFNVYHSLREASSDLNDAPTKWLDLRSLLTSYLPVIGRASLEHIYYFSALAFHVEIRQPGVTAWHRVYMECLSATGITIELGRFKKKSVRCKKCREESEHFEEKETDVAISVRLIELLHRDAADTIVLVTGDTDLAPAVRTALDLFPTKQMCFAFPYKRKNRELAKLVTKSFQIRKERYLQHQFPNPYKLPTGREISKPPHW